ncbi:MAG: ABC transporter substrate-binding protein [Polaromonas sp.]|uniref:ABC transporter substrate-binding protein n=1 Tax=Polaromonas sp. TaxID=1869339 RepID=UPI0025D8418A|nr:ABC transporter substrate-binding protein [Polaromonas sp.]MBI2726278.1 ABC transporter substrate-binding protein [Polaromonas sp.]
MNTRRKFGAFLTAIGMACLGAFTLTAHAQNIKIGVLFPTKTINGKQGVQGAQLAADMVNASGGVLGGRKLEVVAYDTNLNPVDGVAATQRLIDQDRIKIITGELSSSVALAVIPVIKSEGAMFIAAVPKHPDVTKSGYDKVFRLNSTSTMDAAAFDAILKRRAPAGKKVALIAENNDYGRLTTDAYKKLFGSQVAFADMFAMTQTDFNSSVTNLRQVNPDLTCIGSSNAEQWSSILRVMTEFKLQTQRCIMPGFMNMDGVKLAGGAAEGLFSADIYTPTISTPLNQQFVKAYQAKNGKAPEKIEALAFEAVWIAAEAIKKAGTADDMTKLATTMRAGTWNTPRGTVKFDAQGQASSGDLLSLEVRNGAIVQAK